MRSTLEPLEGDTGKKLVKLSVEVDEAEFDRDLDAAFKKIAREVRIPGFRPGKAPGASWRPVSEPVPHASRPCATPFPSTWPKPCANTRST